MDTRPVAYQQPDRRMTRRRLLKAGLAGSGGLLAGGLGVSTIIDSGPGAITED